MKVLEIFLDFFDAKIEISNKAKPFNLRKFFRFSS